MNEDSRDSASSTVDDDEGKPTAESVQKQMERYAPDVGYKYVEWDLMKAPLTEEYLIPWSSGQNLRLSQMSARPGSEFQDWSVIDQYATDHYRSLQNLPANPDPETVEDAVKIIHEEDSSTRVALARIARIADNHPEECSGALSDLTTDLVDADTAVQAEIVGISETVAETHPDAVATVVEELFPLLSPTTHPELLAAVVRVVALVAEHDALAVRNSVPKLETILTEGEPVEQPALRALSKIAKAHPDAVIPLAPKLIKYLDQEPDTLTLSALAALGYISKPYPYVAEQTIPEATALLNADDDRLRANASGLLADLSTEYAEQLRSVVPQAIDLLKDEDKKVQANASSLLARVAHTNPEVVAVGTDSLIRTLDADTEDVRLNACWTLGYLNAQNARDRLAQLKSVDPSDSVRAAAVAALTMLNIEDCPHCNRICDANEVEVVVHYPERVNWTCSHCKETVIKPLE